MSYETILFDVDADGVATLTLNRPEKRNAWNRQMGLEIRAALKDADARDGVRVVIVTGAGKDFCVGRRPRRRRQGIRGGRGTARPPGGERLSLKAWDVRKPIIGALNGAVAGVGATLPLHWDIRLAGESTRITFVFPKRGLTPEAASTWMLPRIIGVTRASELLLTRSARPRARGARDGARLARRARCGAAADGAVARPRVAREPRPSRSRSRSSSSGASSRSPIRRPRRSSTASSSAGRRSRPTRRKASARSSRSGRPAGA